MHKNNVETHFYQTGDYVDFVLNKEHEIRNKLALVKLNIIDNQFMRYKLKSITHANINYKLTKQSNIDWDFEVYQMQRSLINKTEYKVNFKVSPILTQKANKVLLLAMISGNVEIVKYFMSHRLFNINDSIFGPANCPSYFILACTCSDPVFQCFITEYVTYPISWCSLTPHLLCSMTGKRLPKNADLDFITYQQYKILNEFRGVDLIPANKNYPLFILDFLCMSRNSTLTREVLERIPEAGALSRLSFIVQNLDHFILILTKYGFRPDQEFNGSTSLHLNAFCNRFYTLIFLIYSGLTIQTDDQDKFPGENCDPAISKKVSELFSICAFPPHLDAKTNKRIRGTYIATMSAANEEFLKMINLSSDKRQNIWGVFKYLRYNRENRILNASRFKITSIFSLTKTPQQVEKEVEALIMRFEEIKQNMSDEEIRTRYYDIYRRINKT